MDRHDSPPTRPKLAARARQTQGAGTDSNEKSLNKQGFLNLLLAKQNPNERLRIWRLCMVLAGFAPLFMLIAIRGNKVVPDLWLWIFCAAMVILPTSVVITRLAMVYHGQTPRPLNVGKVDDTRSHVLVYLFAALLPFYRQAIVETRDFVALGVALTFIIFLFWHLNLHYINVALAVLGFHVYTVQHQNDGNPYTSRLSIILITRRHSVVPGDTIQSYRLSDTLYWGLQE